MDYIGTYYNLSQAIKEKFEFSDLTDKQKKEAKKILDAFEAAEKVFTMYSNKISELNDAIAWHKQITKKSENNYADYWRSRFYKLKQFANGNIELNSEIIEMLK